MIFIQFFLFFSMKMKYKTNKSIIQKTRKQNSKLLLQISRLKTLKIVNLKNTKKKYRENKQK